MLHWAAEVSVVPRYEVHDTFGRFVARGDV